MQKSVTIYDIAKASGCSPATVSLALNNDERVKKETAIKIQKKAAELDYRPSYFGRSLITGKSKTIKVVLPDIHNPVFVNILDGVESHIGQTEYHLVLEVTNNDKDKELESFASLLGGQVDGVIISPIFEEEVTAYLLKKGIDLQKVVYAGSTCTGSDKIHYCMADSRLGAYKGVKNMLENGCKCVAFLAPTVLKLQSSNRVDGYLQALQEYEIAYDEKLLVNCSQDFHEIYDRVSDLLKEEKPDGVFCLYDYAAIPVLKAAADLGLRVPEDLMVTGYDDIESVEFLQTPLTTVNTHLKEQGAYAAKMMIDLLEEKECPIQNVFEPDLVVRKTTVTK
mgnify:FL=1